MPSDSRNWILADQQGDVPLVIARDDGKPHVVMTTINDELGSERSSISRFLAAEGLSPEQCDWVPLATPDELADFLQDALDRGIVTPDVIVMQDITTSLFVGNTVGDVLKLAQGGELLTQHL